LSRLLLKERTELTSDTLNDCDAIQVLVDLVTTGEDAEELSIYVWENNIGNTNTQNSQIQTSTDNSSTSTNNPKLHANQRKLSNKIKEAYEEIFHSSKVEIDKAGFLENAFRPVYTGNNFSI
jgi:hypothetical protein